MPAREACFGFGRGCAAVRVLGMKPFVADQILVRAMPRVPVNHWSEAEVSAIRELLPDAGYCASAIAIAPSARVRSGRPASGHSPMNRQVMWRFSMGDQFSCAVGRSYSTAAESRSITFGARAIPVNRRMREQETTVAHARHLLIKPPAGKLSAGAHGGT